MPRTEKKHRKRRLEVQSLESRQMMAGDATSSHLGPHNETSYFIESSQVVEGKLGDQAPAGVRLRRTGKITETVPFDIQVKDGTAKARDSDYAARSFRVTFPAGQSSIWIPITVFGDNRYEPHETIQVTARGPVRRGPFGIPLAPSASGTLTVLNDDPLPSTTVVPLTGDMTVSEGDYGHQRLSFLFAPNRPSSNETVVRVRTQNGSARAGDDFTSVDTILRWAPRDVEPKSVDVLVTGDLNYRDRWRESFQVVIEPANNNTRVPQGNSISVTIVDNDEEPIGPLPSLVFDRIREAEGPKGQRIAQATLRLTHPAIHQIGIKYQTITGGGNGNATAGDDFREIGGQVIFYPGQTEHTIDIPILGDNLVEADEFFHVELLGDANRVRIPNPKLGVSLINDDDSISSAEIATFLNGTWWIDSGNGSSAERSVQFGLPGDVPLTGDYNGDGNLDLVAVRDNYATGMLDWYFDYSADGTLDQTLHYGLIGDEPVAGDFNGDGVFEATVVRPNYWTGGLDWYIDLDHRGFAAEQITRFGNIGDTVVPGDFDGNGRTDFGVARKEGQFLRWYLDTAGDGVFAERDAVFGLATDQPLVGDWDGDGDDDFAVARKTPQPGIVDILLDLSDGDDREEEKRLRYDWGEVTFLSL
ncbi:MAG: Calx-beta domain-containing protein [Planctomycetota bacterium]